MATFSSPADSVISSGGNIVGVDLVRQDVPSTNQGGNTIVYEGYTPEACTLSEITVFMKTLNTQGTYTATFTNVTTGNTVLGSANFNMQTLSANTWTTLTLTGTASDLSFAADDRFRVSFASNNTSFDGAGIYFTMRFTSNTSYTPRAMDLLFSTTLTSSAASISTGTLPTGYKSLIIDTSLRCDGAFTSSIVNGYINNDQTDSNYRVRRGMFMDGDIRSESFSFPYFVGTTGALASANHFSFERVRFSEHESTIKFKNWYMAESILNSPSAAQHYNISVAGLWLNTDAITSITFAVRHTSAPSFVAGSSVHIYGIK